MDWLKDPSPWDWEKDLGLDQEPDKSLGVFLEEGKLSI
jgi:hypothetical protein